ncbi:saccharopine dehydrogenase NADP-binding domain-containing protein [Jiangella ureilytica]|uniref:saccharopine dehydrogenase NADP-binding domain-containing protein n=1 Tax=Jiangella ureilytica TaxID=2530374 RepID=UPI0013A5D356|nr:saccharopine dehydrogenase NADP-binding domain-containing protein [Jiangella ureilytica]
MTGRRRDRGAVVILGGYGAVAREVADLLAARIPGRVVVAGRDGDRAAALASRYGGALVPRRVRVDHPDEVIPAIAAARVVVMAVETANPVVARMCLTRGIHYVDVSASAEVLASIERLDPLARRHWAGAVLSVGLAPGVTNLLARYCVDRLPGATAVDITVSLGLNGDHGADSLRWTVDNLVAGRSEAGPRAGSGARRVRLAGTGPVTAYPFPFSDQVTLTRTLGVPTTTRLRFESELMTRLVFGLRSAGFFARFQGARRRRVLDAVLSRTRLGTDRFAVQAEAADRDGRRVSAAATGRGECRATAAVVAEVVGALHEGRVDPGVHHLEQLGSPDQLLAGLRRYGLMLHGIPG